MSNLNHEEQMGIMISRYIDNEMTTQEKANIETHLQECTKCNDVFLIFKKNENLLTSALSVEVFGNKIVEEVQHKLKNKDQIGFGGKSNIISSKSYLLTLAASVLILLTGAVLTATAFYFSNLNLNTTLSAQSNTLENYKQGLQDTYKYLAYIQSQNNISTIHNFVQKEHQHPAISSYFETDYVYVTATFEQKEKITHFNCFRKSERDGKWLTINKTPLNESSFLDIDVNIGKVYEYKFIGFASDQSMVESLPILAKSYRSERSSDSVEITCVSVNSEDSTARFQITRYINAIPYIEWFNVKTGEQIGSAKLDSTTGKFVSFATGYSLESITTKERVLIVPVNSIMIDEKTNQPILDPVSHKPKVELRDTVIGQGPDKMVILSKIDPAKTGDKKLTLWRFSSHLLQ